jgi:hypothetical protein
MAWAAASGPQQRCPCTGAQALSGSCICETLCSAHRATAGLLNSGETDAIDNYNDANGHYGCDQDAAGNATYYPMFSTTTWCSPQPTTVTNGTVRCELFCARIGIDCRCVCGVVDVSARDHYCDDDAADCELSR